MVFSQCAVTAGAVVLFAMPGMQVGWDAAFATLMVTAVGLPLEFALAITVLVRCQQLVVVSVGALVLAVMLRRPAVVLRVSSAARRSAGVDGSG